LMVVLDSVEGSALFVILLVAFLEACCWPG